MAKKKEETYEKQLELVVTDLEKKFGIGSIMRMDAKPFQVDVIPTPSILLNHKLGIGGFPLGRICEIYGQEMSGKTTLSIGLMIQAQIAYPNKDVAIIDAEHAFDTDYAESMGLDLTRVWISQPGSAEEALDIVQRLLESCAFSIVVVDSTAALVPEAELEGDFGDNFIGLQARMIGKAMRKLNGLVFKTGTNLTFISQMRANINPMSPKKWLVTGGNAIKFFSSVRINMAIIAKINKSANSRNHGNRVKISVDKNKLSPPHKTCETTILYGRGIVKEIELIELGVDLGIIQKGGAWYTINEQKFAGQDKVLAMLDSDPEFTAELEQKVLAALEEEG